MPVDVGTASGGHHRLGTNESLMSAVDEMVDYDQLDLDRNDHLDSDGIDDFHIGVEAGEVGGGREKHKIRTLEKSLEDEKRRLAAMEMELRDAKKQRGAEQQLTVMRKQSKMLQNMMGTLSSSARKEHAERREWEDEWRQKFDDFHRQHRDMEEALKRRHFQELKALQEDIQRGVRKVAGEVSKSQGRKMPSPRSLKNLQETNMEGLVLLFHKHGQERLFLANKLAKQEEILVRSKNSALQRRMASSQGEANTLYRQYNLPTVKTPGVQRQLTGGGGGEMMAHGGGLSATMPSTMAQRSTMGTRGGMGETGESRRTGARTAGTFRREALPSPRMADGTFTFLTEIENPEDEWGSKLTKQSHGSRDTPSTAPVGQQRQSGGLAPRGNDLSHSKPGFPAPETSGVWGEAGGGGEGEGGHMPGKEFAGWAKPTLQVKHSGNGWDESAAGRTAPPLQQSWHPNIIAFESSTRRAPQQHTDNSPYNLAPLSGTARGKRTKTAGSRATGRSNASSRGAPSQASAGGGRASTTGGGGFSGPKVVRGRELPSMAAAGIQTSKSQPTDQNYNRPFTLLGDNEDFPEREEKLAKLETWIESKIKGVLGDGGDRSSFLSTMGGGSTHGSVPSTAGVLQSQPPSRHGASMGRGQSFSVNTLASEELSDSAMNREDLDQRGATAGSEQVPGGLFGRLRTGGTERQGGGGDNLVGLRLEEGQRRGEGETRGKVSIPQAGGDDVDVEIEGRMDRQGHRVAMAASDDVGERRDALEAAQVRATTGKSRKSVVWDLNGGDGDERGPGDGSVNLMRLDSAPDGGLSTRPTTGASSATNKSRPGTSASSFRDQDSEGDSPRAAPKRTEDVSAEEEKDFFSLVRHNKVTEVDGMLAGGFPIDKRDGFGNTCLMVAAQNGHKRIVKMALKYQADPNSTNHHGNTSLHFATSYGYSALSKYLIGHGADDTLMNMKGLTCYDGIG